MCRLYPEGRRQRQLGHTDTREGRRNKRCSKAQEKHAGTRRAHRHEGGTQKRGMHTGIRGVPSDMMEGRSQYCNKLRNLFHQGSSEVGLLNQGCLTIGHWSSPSCSTIEGCRADLRGAGLAIAGAYRWSSPTCTTIEECRADLRGGRACQFGGQ